jgi:hypothetical protein
MTNLIQVTKHNDKRNNFTEKETYKLKKQIL